MSAILGGTSNIRIKLNISQRTFTFGKSEPMDYGFQSHLWQIASIIVQKPVWKTKLNQKYTLLFHLRYIGI